jgi:hypothetical protein
LVLLALVADQAVAMPFWGAGSSSPADTAPAALKPGEFVWDPGVAPDGPIVVVVVVSLTEQRAYVYRNGIEIGFTTVSTGKPGHQTPTGIFTILQKDKDHHVKAGDGSGTSVLLAGAAARNWMAVPMPGYRDAAGSELSAVAGGRVRIPQDFARSLYPLLVPGTTLLLTDAPVLEENSGAKLTVLSSGNPN